MPTDKTRSLPNTLVMHSMARHYDLLASLVTFGRERQLRERLADLAGLSTGESVLDVGCGTGSLARVARQRVGSSGAVRGVDASPEMIEQAQRKAAKAGLDIAFDVARAEELPLPDASVDVVLSTLMMHHLPRASRELLGNEIHRVLRPGGRLLVVDFEKPANKRGGIIARFHRHGGVPLRDIADLLGRSGLRVTQLGDVGMSDLRFAIATKPRDAREASISVTPEQRSLRPLGAPRLLLPVVLVAIAAAHLIVARGAWTAMTIGSLAAGAIGLFLLLHDGLAAGIAAIHRRHRAPRG